MQALCCLPFPRKRVRIADENAITTLDKVTPPSYDFVSNEDADYQQYLWHLVLEEKTWSFAEARKLVNGTDTVTDMTTPETYLQGLTAAYNESGFGQHMPRIREIFANVESFTHAITIMVQSDMICSLLWGSLMLVFQSVLRAASFWDTTRQMFSDLAKQLPRFHAYADILHTPRLHESLRRVYGLLVDFCVNVVEFQQSARLCGLQWSSFNVEYRKAASELQDATADFKEEVQLAHIQHSERKHYEVLNAIKTSGATSFETNITLPRNEKFTGRDSILTLLHSMLEASFQGPPKERRACSTLIHALGGMGKTEMALEYTYRYRQFYDYIFWLRAESREVLIESFLGVIRLLDIVPDHMAVVRKIQKGLKWFQSSESMALNLSVDTGCALMQLSKVEEAKVRLEEGIELYSHTDTLKIRLFHARSLHVRTLAIMQRKTETREQAETTIQVIQEELGQSNHLTLQTKSYSGHALFTIGDVDRSCELHRDVFEQRLQVDGDNHHLTLGSQYCLAVCHHRKGLLQQARQQFSDILENGVITDTWRLEDVERTKFRLYLVERDLWNINEASRLLCEVQERIYELRISEQHLRILGQHSRKEFTDEDDMALLDANVVSWHGRTAGIWSSGDIW